MAFVTKTTATVQILRGIREQVDGLITLLEGDSESAATPAACEHPLEVRQDISTMGNPRWRCVDCGFIFAGHEVQREIRERGSDEETNT
jgi:hypothetical protein